MKKEDWIAIIIGFVTVGSIRFCIEWIKFRRWSKLQDKQHNERMQEIARQNKETWERYVKVSDLKHKSRAKS